MYKFIANANISSGEISLIIAQQRGEIEQDLQIYYIIGMLGVIFLSLQIVYSLCANWARMNKLMRTSLILYNLLIVASFSFHLIISIIIDGYSDFDSI